MGKPRASQSNKFRESDGHWERPRWAMRRSATALSAFPEADVRSCAATALVGLFKRSL